MNEEIRNKLRVKRDKKLLHIAIGKNAEKNLKYCRYKRDRIKNCYLIRRAKRAEMQLQQFANIRL